MSIRGIFTAMLLSSFMHAANIGDLISNTAASTYTINNIDKNTTSNEVNLTVEGTDASIEFLSADPHGEQTHVLGGSSYLGSDGSWHAMPAPALADGTVLSTTSPTRMTGTNAYNVDDLSLIKVIDADQNIDRNIRNVIEANITSPSGDSETIRLIETTPDSGVFTGYILLTNSASFHGDGRLHVQADEHIDATYNDQGVALRADSALITQKKDLKVWIEKQVNKEVASVGEILLYTLTVHNDESFALKNMQVDDHMPLGLKYKNGTAEIEGTKTKPTLSEDGKHLYFIIPALPANGSIKITFIAEIGAGVHNNEIINVAVANDAGCSLPMAKVINASSKTTDMPNFAARTCVFSSNKAVARTRIVEELMRSKGIIIGQVYECAYEKNKKGHGVANVRLYMENGTYVVTDKSGKYHIEGVDAGTHVVQVDEDLLPVGYVMGDNAHHARLAGRNFSQFVDVGRGALKRVDFCLDRTTRVKEDSNATQAKTDIADIYDYKIPTVLPTMPKYNRGHLRSLRGKTEILWPPEKFVPSIPSTRIAVVHDKEQKAQVWLNGQKVSMLNYDGRKTDTNNSTVIDTYKGVDLLDQTNTITVKILNKQNQVIKTLTRTLHVSTAPAKIEYVEKNSFAVADGKHSPVIAVKFIDADGYPLRSGITGTFSIEAPYQSQVALDQLQVDPLGSSTGENRYTIDSDGIAYIKLQPTTQSGTASLHFKIQDRDEVIRAWLKPQLRKWIMVGFAEGTVGYNTLKGHKESLAAIGAEDKVVTQGRVSFFAKGRVKGEWLLTMAYDSGKDTKNSKLFDEIDPNTYYTLYNDGSVQNYEASTRKKLYLKIEKERFSALFGDFNTDMTVTELSQYSRRMTGIKSEYHGENLEVNAFAAHTDQLFMKDEIRGDGTSGFYHLKNKPVILNSESVTIEVRDRYHNERVIEKKSLQRFRDYEIDYDRGTLYFKEPIYSNDQNFNPRFIVVDYEIEGDGSKHYTYGGRAAVKALNGAVEVGGSYIYEDTAKKKSELYGADTTVKVGTHTVMKAEYAKTKTTQDGNTTYGDAKLAEIEYIANGLYVRGYYREQEDAFGLGQISSSLGATRKFGLDATKTFENRLSLKTSAYRDSDLLNDKNQDVFETRVQMDQTLWSAYMGYRYANNTDSAAVHQMLLGASYAFFDQRLKLSVAHDQSFGEDEDKLFPTKTTVGVDYAVTANVNLFANYEWAKGVDDHELGRVGLRYRPWSGMTFENTTVSEFENDTTRLYNTLGMLQTYQFNEHWAFNIGYERGEALDGNTTAQNVDFNAYRLGINYHTGNWTATINGEYRDAGEEKKYNVTAGIYTQANDDLAFALSAGYNKFEDALSKEEDANMRLSVAYRPEQTDVIVLDKLDLVHQKRNGLDEEIYTQKIINNLVVNYHPNKKTQIALQHGIKYVKDTVNTYEHKGVTQLFGVDAHYDLTPKWMIGSQVSVLYAQSADNLDYGFGLYASYNVMTNMLLTLGYNWEGFEDRDFSLQNYRIEGPYLQFKMKFDQKNLSELVRLMSW
ncbi:hypothetical protein [Sulfurovum sp.]|uniref:hypothetical protein n=2 Tax=Sulfurovum sp. TaxID=1969726 RepID=UPI0025D43A9F|nr:hypothetical protein [Sulfurovum sp.]